MLCSSIKLASRPAFARHVPNDPKTAIVSTYLLDQAADSRSGSLCIINVIEEEEDTIKLEKEIKTTAGVFRFDFRNPSTIVAALTDGSLVVQKIIGEEADNIPVSEQMLLDVGLSDSSLTITTDNKGYAYIVDLNTSLIVGSWLAHTLPFMDNEGCEVWSCSIDKEAKIVVTGAEDSTMKIWDSRTHTSIGQSKVFEAGVVFVDFLENDDKKLLTGSYDENIRIFDRRNLKQALNEKKMSGGVWNIEKNESNYCVTCMYGGYAIVDKDLNILKKNEKAGENLLYGATMVGESGRERVLYCTFNDFLVVLD